MFLARAILSAVFPAYAIKNISNILIPLCYTVLGSVANIGNIKNQLRLEKEAYDKLKVNINKEELKRRLLNQEENSLKMVA